VEGKIQTDQYEKDGVTRYATKIIAQTVQFLSYGGQRREEPQRPHSKQKVQQASQQSVESESRQQKFSQNENQGSTNYDDDVPF